MQFLLNKYETFNFKMRVPKKYSLSAVQIFLSIMTKRKIIGQANYKYYHKTCIDGFFRYPLIDHAQTYNYNKKKIMVAYGYKNERSEEQLARLEQELRDADKHHHLRVVRTQIPDHGKHEMIKVILSMQELDDETWDKLKTFVFDMRYESNQ